MNARFWLVDIKKDNNFLIFNARLWLVDIKKDKNFLLINSQLCLVVIKKDKNWFKTFFFHWSVYLEVWYPRKIQTKHTVYSKLP